MTVPAPFVFVHGLFGAFNDPALFQALAPARCSAPDLAGYGDSRERPVSLPEQVEALRRHLLQHHGHRPVNLVGHSIGAVYAFALADADPELVATVTTVEGNFGLADAFWSASIAALGADDAHVAVESRLADPAAFLAADGIPPTDACLSRAAEALAYQPWSTVWRSAIAVVRRRAGPPTKRCFGGCSIATPCTSSSAIGARRAGTCPRGRERLRARRPSSQGSGT